MDTPRNISHSNENLEIKPSWYEIWLKLMISYMNANQKQVPDAYHKIEQ